jgi:hypothetical protein
MPRTTINLDAPILRDLKRLQKREAKTLGRLISDLLAEALRIRQAGAPQPREFHRISRPMIARIDLRDKEAIHAALDQDIMGVQRPAPR